MRLVALLAVAPALLAQSNSTIRGTVADSVTGRGLAGVAIVFEGAEATGRPPQVDSYIAETDGGGRFRLQDMIPRSYEVRLRREGFTGPRGIARISVNPGQTLDLSLRMVPLSVISGRVVDRDGDAIVEAFVEAMRYSWSSGRKELRAAASVRTNDRGEYRLHGLTPGRYFLRASLLYNSVGSSSRSMPVRGSKVDQVYPVTYFPAGGDSAKASELIVGPGAELRAVNLQLHAQTLFTIRVTVTGGRATAVPQLLVGMRELTRDAPAGSFGLTGPRYDRQIRLPPAKPGTYLISAVDRELDLRGQQLVTVTDADVDATLTVSPGLTFSGTVQVEGRPDAQPDAVRIRLEGEQWWNQGEASVGPDGRFSATHLEPAAYSIRATLPAGLYLKSIRRGDRLLEKPRIDLSQSLEPALITLAADGGTLEGTVTHASGQPAEGAVVVLAPNGSLREWVDLQRTATAGRGGRFELRDLAPGDYLLYAFDGAEAGAPGDADFRRPYEKQATEVRVGPSARQAVAVRALPVQP